MPARGRRGIAQLVLSTVARRAFALRGVNTSEGRKNWVVKVVVRKPAGDSDD